MQSGITIALDAMGGDHAPRVVLSGANIARKRFPDVRFIFFGREDELRPRLEKLKPLAAVSTVVHSDQVVSAEDRPKTVVRQGRESSMGLAIRAVKEGKAVGAVSAGNTGALMGLAYFVLRTLPGIDRPAIASFMPTQRAESVMLDLGANVHCDATNLVDFAVMGNVFARTVLGLKAPSIGLLNVGSEETKGHEALWEAAEILRQAGLPGRFHGFIEGDDIAKGTVDVIVTDGFTGNIALKTAEGTAKLLSEYMRQTFKSSFLARIGYLFARGALRKLRQRTDPRRYNGAMFLGLNGIVVKSHGGTDALGFANAIGVAVDMARHGILEKITADFDGLSRTPPAETSPEGQAAAL